jgi:diguanylate cyclase (GGDEF)-like protein
VLELLLELLEEDTVAQGAPPQPTAHTTAPTVTQTRIVATQPCSPTIGRRTLPHPPHGVESHAGSRTPARRLSTDMEELLYWGVPMADRELDDRDGDSPHGPFERVPDTLARVGVAPGSVLVVDRDASLAQELAAVLHGDGHAVTVMDSPLTAVDVAAGGHVDVVVLDAGGWPGGFDVLDQLRALPGLPPEVVVLTLHNDVDRAVEALHRGAADCLVKPPRPHRLRLAVARGLESRRLKQENRQLRRGLDLVERTHRLLETLDPARLAPLALELLCETTGAHSGALLERGRPVAQRALLDGEMPAVANLRLPASTMHVPPRRLFGALRRFSDALMMDLDGQRQVVLLRGEGEPFGPAQEEDARFLARHVATAFRNTARFASAERRAQRDPLTGLLNASAFLDQLSETLAAQPGRAVSVLFLDLDHFKQVNDQHGHLMGSAVLVEVSRILQASVRVLDTVCRYGGDEFTVLLDGAPVEVAHAMAERIRRSVEKHAFLSREGLSLHLSTCVGVATFPVHGRSARDILDQADRAMYRGKAARRNAVHVAASTT